MNTGKMNNLIKKSQQQFAIQKKEEIIEITKSLMYLSLDKGKEDYDKIRNFFHSIKGTAGTINLLDLYSIATDAEDFMDEKGFEKILENQNMITLLNKLAETQKLIDNYNNEKVIEDSSTISTISKNIDDTLINYTDKVLIIDDDINMLNFLESILRDQGYYVIISSDAEEGIKTLQEENIDLAIVDIMMPKKTGFDIFNYTLKEGIDVPMIFLTGVKDEQVKIRALREGIDDFIEKPFSSENLIARVEGTIKRKKKKTINEITDELTGAYTRKFLMTRFKEEINRHKRTKKQLSIAFVDIDKFKDINDNYGHVLGDKVLKKIVENLKGSLRDYDQVFRYGGDEFVILFPETNEEEAYIGLERAQDKLKEDKLYIEEENIDINISFSAGITMVDDFEVPIQEWLKKADKALYISKDDGRAKTTYGLVKEKSIKKKVLVVDDSPIIVSLVKKRLNHLGYEVESAKDGEEAITKVEDFNPNLMLLDLMLPKKNGIEVLKNIKKDKSSELIVIILSAKNKEKDIVEAFKIGATDYITKPFSLEIMEEKLRKLL